MHLFCKMVGFSSLTEFTVYLTLNHKQIRLDPIFIYFFCLFGQLQKFWYRGSVVARGWGRGKGGVAFTV